MHTHTTRFLNELYEQMCIYILQRETNILLSSFISVELKGIS